MVIREIVRGIATVITLGVIVSCSHTNARDPLAEVWRDPLRADGHLFELTVYPYDYVHDPERYVMCRHECTQAEAIDDPVVIVPLVPGMYDGTTGSQPFNVRVIFRAVCFRENSACPHRPFIFQQIE